MTPILVAAIWFTVGMVFATIIWVTLIYTWGDALIHKMKYKEYVLPCPACRDEETDKPTGVITPDNPYLRSMVAEHGEQTFDCSTCEGTKRVRYEFPRHEKVHINERQILESAAYAEKPGRRWFR